MTFPVNFSVVNDEKFTPEEIGIYYYVNCDDETVPLVYKALAETFTHNDEFIQGVEVKFNIPPNKIKGVTAETRDALYARGLNVVHIMPEYGIICSGAQLSTGEPIQLYIHLLEFRKILMQHRMYYQNPGHQDLVMRDWQRAFPFNRSYKIIPIWLEDKGLTCYHMVDLRAPKDSEDRTIATFSSEAEGKFPMYYASVLRSLYGDLYEAHTTRS